MGNDYTAARQKKARGRWRNGYSAMITKTPTKPVSYLLSPMIDARLTESPRPHASAPVLAELGASLGADTPWISPKFLYDALGSKLFEAICELPEYYPTRTEAAIFDLYGAEMARAIGPGTTLIDLGAGNCAKAA